jgi:hypothetical protein
VYLLPDRLKYNKQEEMKMNCNTRERIDLLESENPLHKAAQSFGKSFGS